MVEFTDYTLPSEAMSHGDLDISNFQNRPYLENAVATRGYDIVAVERSIVTPLGVYSKKLKTLADLPDGALIAIPNDPANGARSLLLLEHAGLIKVTPGAGTAPGRGCVPLRRHVGHRRARTHITKDRPAWTSPRPTYLPPLVLCSLRTRRRLPPRTV